MTSFMDFFLHVIRTLFQQDSYIANQIAVSVISHSPHQVWFDHSLPSRPVIPIGHKPGQPLIGFSLIDQPIMGDESDASGESQLGQQLGQQSIERNKGDVGLVFRAGINDQQFEPLAEADEDSDDEGDIYQSRVHRQESNEGESEQTRYVEE